MVRPLRATNVLDAINMLDMQMLGENGGGNIYIYWEVILDQNHTSF